MSQFLYTFNLCVLKTFEVKKFFFLQHFDRAGKKSSEFFATKKRDVFYLLKKLWKVGNMWFIFKISQVFVTFL